MRRENNRRIRSSLKKKECISMRMVVKLLRLSWLMEIKKIEMMKKVIVKIIVKKRMININNKMKVRKMIIAIMNKKKNMDKRKKQREKREKWLMR